MTTLLLLASLAATPTPTSPQEKEAVLWSKLEERLRSVERALDGVLGVWVKDLKTGRTIELRANEVFPTASSIKLAVLYELYRQVEEARLDLSEVTRPPLPRVRGGGVLQELGDHVSLSWRDLAVLMMGWSDNEATNLLIERVGRDAVNRRLDALGLGATRLRRKMMDVAAAQRGDENVSTAAELGRLMETLHAGTGLSPERAKDMMAVAAIEKWGTTSMPASPFRGPLPEGLTVADKAGELEGVRCVTAAVDLKGRPYVAAIMTAYLKRELDGEAAVREISAALYETFDRLARGSEYGRLLN
jgi:beta-lactamase class A